MREGDEVAPAHGSLVCRPPGKPERWQARGAPSGGTCREARAFFHYMVKMLAWRCVMRIGRLRSGLLVVLLVGSLTMVACSPSPPFGGQASAAELRSNQPRIAAESPEADLRTLTDGNTAFALDLYRALGGQDNLFFSPHSVSIALAMTYAGAASVFVKRNVDQGGRRKIDHRVLLLTPQLAAAGSLSAGNYPPRSPSPCS